MDRVCGMWVKMKDARFTSSSNATTYYFCSQVCKDQFDQDSERYVKGFEGRRP